MSKQQRLEDLMNVESLIEMNMSEEITKVLSNYTDRIIRVEMYNLVERTLDGQNKVKIKINLKFVVLMNLEENASMERKFTSCVKCQFSSKEELFLSFGTYDVFMKASKLLTDKVGFVYNILKNIEEVKSELQKVQNKWEKELLSINNEIFSLSKQLEEERK